MELLKNGEKTGDTLTLDDTNDWTGSFSDLDEYTDGALNEYTVGETRDISGIKTWDDDNDKADARPDYIIVNLYRSDALEEVYRSKTVPADDDWAMSWTGLPKTDENGEDYDYTIDEEEVEYYTPAYKTGDTNNIGLWIALLVVAVAAVYAAFRLRKRS